MMMLGTYEIIEVINTDRKRILYRVRDPETRAVLLIKVYQADGKHAVDEFLIKNEFEILSSLNKQGFAKVIRVENVGGLPALVMVDHGGVPLCDYLRVRKPSFSQKLQLCHKLAVTVTTMHALHIVHKGLSSTSIFINPDTEEVTLGEFGLAQNIQKNTESIFTGIGSLDYTSPEQTGRTSRSVDYRSDIYSLGIVFYEIICTRLPFMETDINSLIFAHMTQIPKSPYSINPEIPVALSDIIMKMIAKDPDERYRSSRGMLSDLEWVASNPSGIDVTDHFILGKNDISMLFTVPAKPFGKSHVMDRLDEIRSDLRHGGNTLVLLEGPRGCGKTFVLNEIARGWANNSGTTLTVDLNVYKTMIPYQTVRVITDRFLEMLQFTQSPKWDSFIDGLEKIAGPNLQLLGSVLPSLLRFCPQMEGEAFSYPNEQKSQIERVMTDFAELLVKYDPPLTLLIDGISNMDPESLSLLKLFFKHRFSHSFLLIGATESAESILTSLESDAEAPGRIEVLSLTEYSESEVNSIVRDIFGLASKKASHLGKIIFSKTNGNPYFTMAFIKKCCEEGLIYFSADFGEWDYKTEEIGKFQTAANVAERAIANLNHLDSLELDILKVAAVTGFEFTLEDLAGLANLPTGLLSDRLLRAMEFGLLAGRMDYQEVDQRADSGSLVFRFSHESIYQRLLDLTDEASRMEVSYAFGQILIEKGRSTTEELGILLSHMNAAAKLLKTTDEKRQLAQLNLEYAVRLKRIGVLEKSYEHALLGLMALGTEKFQEADTLSFKLNLERAELAYLNRRFNEAESYFDALIANCSLPLNQARVIRSKMTLNVNQGRMKETIALAAQALNALGVPFNGSPSNIQVGRELLIYNTSIIRKQISDLEKLPVSTDSDVFMITEIYMTLISVSYLVGKNLFIYVILRILNLTMKHGLTVHSSYAFSIYGLISGSAFGNPKKGLEYGEVGIRLAERFGNQDILAKCLFSNGFFLNHWVNPPSTNLPLLSKAITISYQTGDMVFYSYSVAAYILSLIDSGTPLDRVLNSVEHFFDSVQAMHVEDVFNLLVLLRQVIFALKGETDDPTSLNAVDFDESVFAEKLKSSSMQSIYAVYLVQKLKLYYMYGQFDMALEICSELQEYAQELMGLSVYPEYYQYYSLTLLEIDARRQSGFNSIHANQRKLAHWMRFAPQNFRHRWLIVQGVWQYKRGHHEGAVQHLAEALQIAQRQGYVQDEALINEILGNIYIHTNQAMIRRMYLKNAYALYKHWGAVGKERNLRTCYTDILFEDADEAGNLTGERGLVSSLDAAPQQIDILSVFKSAQALSSETQPSILLKRVLEIITENAGAQKTVILMNQDNLIPVAWTTPEGIAILDDKAGTTCDYPETIVNQVARTREPVVIEDVSRAMMLRKDPYVMRYEPVSMMCLPIIWKGNLYGLLYLENNRMSGAFSWSRIEVMQVLTAQFVISYDNALLYESLRASEADLKTHKYKLERIVEERTAELSRANFEIQMLLDHVGQGFFSFDHTGHIGTELSRECYRIFQINIAGVKVQDLLGTYCGTEEAPLLGRIIEKAFRTATIFESKVYLSLLPQEMRIHDKIIAVEYQMIDDSEGRRVMTILTDVTETHELMQIREEEKQNLKMIVKIIKNRNSFLRSLEDYRVFTHDGCCRLLDKEDDPSGVLVELYRMVHTFKGDFAQWGFRHTESALHEIESLIAYHRSLEADLENMNEFIEELDFDKAIEKDLQILENSIGRSFLQGDEYYEVSRSDIMELEVLSEKGDMSELQSRIKEMRRVNLKELLHPFDDYVETLAFGLDKKVNPILVDGDDIRIDRKAYHNLMKVLTHIFRNMMDYGIELPEERARLSKSEYGTIACLIQREGESVIIEISDDGSGIDTHKLLEILIRRDSDREAEYLAMEPNEVLEFIFSDGVSTSGDITMLSGRGIGLSAVREEVERLGGTISVFSTPNIGSRFIIKVPVIN